MGAHSNLSKKTRKKWEVAADKKFIIVDHKGNWGHCARCIEANGDIWDVNKKTKECVLDEEFYWKNNAIRRKECVNE